MSANASKLLTTAFVIIVLLTLCFSDSFAETWQVPSQCPTIQAGIDSATAGDTVLVACGTYLEHDIVMKSGVCLRSETGEANCVAIDAQQQGRVFYCNNLSSMVTFSGLTITGGSAGNGEGGGIYCTNSFISVSNCNIEGNTTWDGGGAGVMVRGGSNAAFIDCLFHENSAAGPNGPGGGLYVYSSNFEAIGCEFSGNYAGERGAGVMASNSDCTFSYCVFYDNTAGERGAGMYCGGSASVLIRNCTFVRNSTGWNGAGVFAYGSAAVTLEGTIIVSSEDGEAVHCGENGTATLTCCDLYGNAGGDWVGCIAGQDGVDGNFSADPLFCDPASDDFKLNHNSPCLPGNHPYGEDCGLIGALSQGCGIMSVLLDIRPRSCPNPFNIIWLENIDKENEKGNAIIRKGGVMPAAIVGSERFDVTEIDVSTLLLEGVAPQRYGYEDVTSPVTSINECACVTGRSDGFVDLTLKFSTQEIAATIGPSEVDDVVELTLTGTLMDGTLFEASDCVTIVGKRDELPSLASENEIVLKPAVPNPFNPITRISYYLPGDEFVRMSIFDVTGKLVQELVRQQKASGEHVVQWNANGMPSGIYFYRLKAGKKTLTKKMILLK